MRELLKVTKSKNASKSHQLIIFLIILTLMTMAGFLTPRFWQRPAGNKVIAKVIASPTPAPSPTPTPQPSPTPTPVLTGYCLNVPILLYHHIQPYDLAKQKGQTALTVDAGIFDSQMGYLASSGYSSLNMNQLADALAGHRQLGRSVVVTLDDGYQDAFTYAYPVLQKYHIVANLMIPTGLLNNNDYLNWNQLKSMVGSGLVFAYDHTWSHANLAAVSVDKMRFEVLTAKKQLEENLGKPVNIFAYPYGWESNQVINFLQANGFVAAVSTIGGTVQCDSIIMSLRRTRIGNSSLRAYGL